MLEDEVEWTWLPNGDLKTTSRKLSAVRTLTNIGGKNFEVFFNQVIAAYTGWNDSRNTSEKAVVFGISRETLPKAEMDQIVDLMNDLAVAFDWQAGDVLLIDNRIAMHSRRAFVKPRVVLASLCR
jgi:hypothetical protein